MTNRNKIFTIIFSLTVISLAFSFAHAEDGLSISPIKVELNNNIEAGTSNVPVDIKYKSDTDVKVETTSVKVSDEAKTEDNTKGTTTSESHRSAVAAFVQSLLKVADKEKGIGAQVKVIAQAQQSSDEKTVEATKSIETRSKIKTFFFGADYKNLGVLISEKMKTDNQIKQLEELVKKAYTTSGKAELNAQIEVLKAEQLKIQSFVDAHMDVFSLFGWVKKFKQ
jgi:glucan-binding YG repeat protein